MHELVKGKLLKDVEGTCTGRYFIITVLDSFEISEGRILPGSGLAEFTVGYRAVVWRPFKGETVSALIEPVLPCALLTSVDRLMPLSPQSTRSAFSLTLALYPSLFPHM